MSSDLSISQPAEEAQRMQLIVYYCDQFVLPLPDGHRFPMDKYRRLRQRVTNDPHQRFSLRVPDAISIADLTLSHDAVYVQRILTGDVSRDEQRELGFPWSPELVERSRRSAGATLAACETALQNGISVSLAGGTHHAFADRPQGFCVFNDSIIAARCLRRDGAVSRVLVIDCDVHQGNGTALMARDEPDIFTFSIHGAKNFPARKESSDLDVAIDDGAGDSVYLRALSDALSDIDAQFTPDLVIYLAGADPYHGDRWGRVGLTKEGLRSRDHIVMRWCQSLGLPLVVTMAGGYAENIDDIVDIHFATVSAAAELCEITASSATVT